MDRKVIKASEGMILTNGEIYGNEIFLAESVEESSFYEISIEEYENILKTEEMQPNPEIATIEDYQASLKRLGVE